MINNSIVITKYQDRYVSWLDADNKMEYLSVSDPENDLVGNIYLGRVKSQVQNINACFVELQDKKLGFLSYGDCIGQQPKNGDLVCVQVVKAASKNKHMMLSCKLNIQGYYCAVMLGSGIVHVSKNITGDLRGRLKKEFANMCSHDVVIRSNSVNAQDDVIKKEINELSLKLDDIITKSKTRTAFSLLYKAETSYTRFIEGMKEGSYDRVISDCPEVVEQIEGCVLYKDEYPLIKLYCLESKLGKLLEKKVYLKSGGDIVIEYTEAMTVIDVNSGKNENKTDKNALILQTNSEAAVEVARQIRLRNISGIIIVDFVNMNSDTDREKLIQILTDELRKDKVRADFIDITKLGLAEIVRKKTSPPVYELLT